MSSCSTRSWGHPRSQSKIACCPAHATFRQGENQSHVFSLLAGRGVVTVSSLHLFLYSRFLQNVEERRLQVAVCLLFLKDVPGWCGVLAGCNMGSQQKFGKSCLAGSTDVVGMFLNVGTHILFAVVADFAWAPTEFLSRKEKGKEDNSKLCCKMLSWGSNLSKNWSVRFCSLRDPSLTTGVWSEKGRPELSVILGVVCFHIWPLLSFVCSVCEGSADRLLSAGFFFSCIRTGKTVSVWLCHSEWLLS